MVNTLSAAAATADQEKKRKQSVDRARANHLSRQLQMRLQYARLKVDHGWQTQTLNEVENLYFHHSALKAPKVVQATPTPLLAAARPTSTSADSASSARTLQSSLSFKVGSSSLTRTSTLEDVSVAVGSFKPNTLGSQATVPDLTTATSEALGNSECPSVPSVMSVTQLHQPTPPIQQESRTLSDAPLLQPRAASPIAPWPSPPPTNFVRLPSLSTQKPVFPSQSGGLRGLQSSSLTYDSFWSSHAGSSTQYRPSNLLQPAPSLAGGSKDGSNSSDKDIPSIRGGNVLVEA